MTDFPPFEPRAWRARADELATSYPERGAALIPLLLEIQERLGCVSREAEAFAAAALGLPPIQVQEVLSFYSMLRRRPRGRHHIRVCRNLSCTLLGAEGILEELERRLGCPPGETSADGEFSWETVECLGACEQAPMLQCDDVFVGPLTPEKVAEVLTSPPRLPEPEPPATVRRVTMPAAAGRAAPPEAAAAAPEPPASQQEAAAAPKTPRPIKDAPAPPGKAAGKKAARGAAKAPGKSAGAPGRKKSGRKGT